GKVLERHRAAAATGAAGGSAFALLGGIALRLASRRRGRARRAGGGEPARSRAERSLDEHGIGFVVVVFVAARKRAAEAHVQFHGNAPRRGRGGRRGAARRIRPRKLSGARRRERWEQTHGNAEQCGRRDSDKLAGFHDSSGGWG